MSGLGSVLLCHMPSRGSVDVISNMDIKAAIESGEDPQLLYTVEFAGPELWGRAAEAGSTVCLDLFEPYLETP